jgi:hypothetical protein
MIIEINNPNVTKLVIESIEKREELISLIIFCMISQTYLAAELYISPREGNSYSYQ